MAAEKKVVGENALERFRRHLELAQREVANLDVPGCERLDVLIHADGSGEFLEPRGSLYSFETLEQATEFVEAANAKRFALIRSQQE